MQNLVEYQDLCNNINVVLLSDVFENLRAIINKKNYVDPINFVTVPSLSCMSALKKTKIEFELLTDTDVYENQIRGGTTKVMKHYTEANNK